MYYQVLLNERDAAAMPTSFKMTFGALGFKVMDPFDWTKDKAIYQRWQLWSEKARHALESMEGYSEKTKTGRTARHSLARRTMRNLMKIKKRQVLFRQDRKLLHTV